MKQSKKYAVTGGIGSGKSAFLRALAEAGFPVFSCDAIYAEMRGDARFLRALGELFPACVRNGAFDFSLLSERVFSDEAERARLNAFTHPKIMERLMARMEKEKVSFAEVPLLFEGGYEGAFDGVIALRRDDAARIASVCARSGLSEAEVRARMARQWDAARLAEKKCIIVENDGSEEDLRRKAGEALRSLFAS